MMTKKKPIKQPEPTLKVFTVESEHGTMNATKHQFNGKVYIQRELLSPQLDAIGELLIESDIFSSVKQTPDGLNVDAGLVMSHLIRKKMIRAFLCLILRHEDGTLVTESEFDGKASEYIRFTSEVFKGFFITNPDALKDIGMFLMSVLGVSAGGGQLIAMMLAGKS